ncbi:hypothetical protein [Novosphingobium gossypii]|uniref:hypothetical protein n=1 Tax=Novosphingobium gossypii TaxID=1604774 RepID=UPI003D20A982
MVVSISDLGAARHQERSNHIAQSMSNNLANVDPDTIRQSAEIVVQKTKLYDTP